MTLRKLVWRNLCHYKLVNLATMLGVVAGVAAITGSLLVGDSIRISLRRIALERLGSLANALVAPDFFADDLADRVEAAVGAEGGARIEPAILLDGIVHRADDPDGSAPVAGVQVVAARNDGWDAIGVPAFRPSGRQAAVNRELASELGVKAGDALIVTVVDRSQAPVHSPFGRRGLSELERRARVIVGEVVENRFSLSSDELRPRNLYLDLNWVQGALDFSGKANALWATGEIPPDISFDAALREGFTLVDYGLDIEAAPERPDMAFLKPKRVILAPRLLNAAERTARERAVDSRAHSMYLANSMSPESGGNAMPYSVVMGIDGGLGGLTEAIEIGPPKRDEIILTDWAADDMGVGAGDIVRIEWFVTRSDGALGTVERGFRVKGIVPMENAAFTRSMVPRFEGVTETTSMLDWDAPFPIDYGMIRPKDEDFWRRHGPTPKAFLAFEVVREMWEGDDAGAASVTGLVLLKQEGAIFKDGFAADLVSSLVPADVGMAFLPVREQALRSAEGSTDFTVLFLSMSFFVVAAAVGLVALLVRLSVERRASELGLLRCVGFAEPSVRRVLLAEGVLIAFVGSIAGAWAGAAYSRGVVAALAAQWAGAVADFPVRHHVTAGGLVWGGAAGFAVALLAMAWASRLLRKRRTLTLLFGWRALSRPPSAKAARLARRAAWTLAILAAALGVLSFDGWVIPAQAGFFGCGAALLLAGLCAVCAALARASEGRRPPQSMRALALRDAPRAWLRDLLTLGLIASATFILVTVGANRRDLTRLDTRRLESGAGGFPLVVETRFGIHYDLDQREGVENVAASGADIDLLAQSRVVGLRLSQGDDASCLNIQQPLSPRVLGVPSALVQRGGFSFSKTLGAKRDNPWELLEESLDEDVVPAFADAASAQWILRKSLGDVIESRGAGGETVRLKLVGLLRESIFASELLIAESQFIRLYGREGGYRRFLAEPPEGKTDEAKSAFREGLRQAGAEVHETAELLASYARVQNSYLIAFQTLGGLGLLLGVFGVVVVLLRNVWERRQEFALMLALGFTRRRLVGLVLVQNGFWLVVGVALGAASALLATAPHLLSDIADVSWPSLAGTLAAVLAIGLASCALASALTVRRGLIQTLRSE